MTGSFCREILQEPDQRSRTFPEGVRGQQDLGFYHRIAEGLVSKGLSEKSKTGYLKVPSK